MALPILDGNQSATTLSTILTGGAHIPAHTVVSLGSQAITDFRGAVSGSVVSISNFPATQTIAGTVTANVLGVDIVNGDSFPIPISEGGNALIVSGIDGKILVAPPETNSSIENRTFHVEYGSLFNISNWNLLIPAVPEGTIIGLEIFNSQDTVRDLKYYDGTSVQGGNIVLTNSFQGTTTTAITSGLYTLRLKKPTAACSSFQSTLVSGSTQGSSHVRIFSYSDPYYGSAVSVAGTVTVGSCVTHGVTIANSSVTVNGTFYQATQPVSLASVPTHGVTLTSTTVTVSSLPSLAAGTAQIGSVTASISGTVPVSGTFWQSTQPVSLATVPTHGVTLASTTVTVSSLPAISGTVTANSIYPKITLINGSGSVTTANTAVTVFATSSTRSYLLVQVTTGSAYIDVGATATTANGIYLTTGQGYAWETTIPQGIVSLISTATGTAYCAKQA